MNKETKMCVICEGDIGEEIDPITGEVFWEYGHNAAPVTDGTCCGSCNATVVIPARLNRLN